jgi:hypothetical protein
VLSSSKDEDSLVRSFPGLTRITACERYVLFSNRAVAENAREASPEEESDFPVHGADACGAASGLSCSPGREPSSTTTGAPGASSSRERRREKRQAGGSGRR